MSRVFAEEPPLHRRVATAVHSLPNMVYRDEPDLRDRVSAIIGSQQWDAIWFSRVRVYRLCADLVDGPQVLDLDDLNDRLLTSLASDRSARLGAIRALPKNAANRVGAHRWASHYRRLGRTDAQLVVCHDGQRNHLEDWDVAIVPNGYPQQHGPEPEPNTDPTILFVGPLTYEPNYLAVRWFVDEVLDRIRAFVPDARLSVVGDLGPTRSDISHEAVTLHGFAPDVEPYYNEARIAVAPLHSGAGTRVKILEAMARCTPMVSTPFACQGLGLSPGQDLSVAESAGDFAAECVALLTDCDKAAKLTDHAFKTHSAHHQATRSSAAVAELVRDVLARADGDRTGQGPEGRSR